MVAIDTSPRMTSPSLGVDVSHWSLYFFRMNKDPKLFFIFPLILLPTTCHCQMNYCSKLPNEYDILFLLDSTLHVGTKEKHKRMLEFVVEFAHQMRLIDGEDNGNKIAFAQFTPELKFEFGFDEFPSEIYKQKTIGASKEEIIELIKRRILVSFPLYLCLNVEEFALFAFFPSRAKWPMFWRGNKSQHGSEQFFR